MPGDGLFSMATMQSRRFWNALDIPEAIRMEKEMYAIIPDVHADYDRFATTLKGLGFEKERDGKQRNVWTHPEKMQAIFLGDFIDRGENNARVLSDVGAMLGAGHAKAIMGNHELNALLFHTSHLDPGTSKHAWLRERTKSTKRQHRTFLAEFPANDDTDFDRAHNMRTARALSWFRKSPLFFGP